MLNKKKLIDNQLKSLYSVFLGTSELFSRNSDDVELSDYEKALLTLIASVIMASGKIDESELKLSAAFFRNNAPVDRANKLFSQLEIMLKNKDSLSIENAAKVINEKLSKSDVQKLFNALIQYSIDHKLDKDKEAILNKIGNALHYSQDTITLLIENKQKFSQRSQRYGKIGGIAFVVIFLGAIVLLAGFLRPIFLGLAFAYLMDPFISFFEKKTRFSRNKICIASIVIFLTIVTLGTLKIVSSINFDDVKSFALNAPNQLLSGLDRFKGVLKEKNVPPQVIEPIDQLLYGSMNFNLEDIQDTSLDAYINSILNTPLDNNETLLTLFPENKSISTRLFAKKEAFIEFLNDIIGKEEMRHKFIKNCNIANDADINIFDFQKLDDIHQKILVRKLFHKLYLLKKFTSTSENVTKHIKELLVTDVAKYSDVFGGIFAKLKIFSSILIDIVLAIGFYYFFTIKFYQIGKGILEIVPVAYRYNTDQIFRKINWILEGYMRGQFSLILLEACFYTLVFYLVGIKYFYIFGLISGVAVLVPYLGILTAFSLTLTAAIAGGMNMMTAIIFLAVLYGCVNLIENLVLAPKLVGDRVGLSDLETLIAIVAGGSLAGVVGVVVAIPVAAILKVFLKMLYEWYKESSFYLQEFPIDEAENEPKGN